MMLKKIIRSVLPAPLYEKTRQLKFIVFRPSPPASDPEGARAGIFLSYSPRATFAKATTECELGYGGEQMLEKAHRSPHAWLTQMQDYAATLLASIALAAMSADKRRLKVLDFGGGIGIFRPARRYRLECRGGSGASGLQSGFDATKPQILYVDRR